MKPSAPVLYGLPVIHKNDCPIRPVIAYVTAPACRLCKLMDVLLPEAIDF